MRTRRFDPARRDRIIEAALDLVAEDGVAGATYRKIAARADVPLGSLTYHFSGVDDLLSVVFLKFIERSAAGFKNRIHVEREKVSSNCASFLLDTGQAEETTKLPRELVLYSELNALAMRRPEWRRPLLVLKEAHVAALEESYDERTAALIGIVMDSLATRVALDPSPETSRLAAEVLNRLLPADATGEPHTSVLNGSTVTTA